MARRGGFNFKIPYHARRRADVFRRDGFTCQACGWVPETIPGPEFDGRYTVGWGRFPASRMLHLDHVYPIALGGTGDPDNLQTLCEPCNIRKGARV